MTSLFDDLRHDLSGSGIKLFRILPGEDEAELEPESEQAHAPASEAMDMRGMLTHPSPQETGNDV